MGGADIRTEWRLQSNCSRPSAPEGAQLSGWGGGGGGGGGVCVDACLKGLWPEECMLTRLQLHSGRSSSVPALQLLPKKYNKDRKG